MADTGTMADATTAKAHSFMLRAAIMDGDGDLVETLLRRGADPNYKAERGGATPLLVAAGQEQVEIVRQLLRAGAEPWHRDKSSGFSALDLASMDGEDREKRLAIIRAIASHPTCDIDSEGPYGNRPSGGGTALFKATVQGEVESVRLLLSLGARANIGIGSHLPRDVAVQKGRTDIVRLFDNPPAVEPRVADKRPGHNLLRLRMEDSADGHRGEMLAAMKTPASDRTQRQVDLLMTMANVAATQNDVGLLKLLLSKNANTSYRAVDLDSADHAEGFTLLHDAAGSRIPNAEAVKLLLKHGADPAIRSKRGHTPLDVAKGKCQDLCAGTNEANARILRCMKTGTVADVDADLEVGAKVSVRGLKKRADLNGQRGVIVSGPGPTGRWEVRLDGESETKTIAAQPANLELVPEERARKDAIDAADGLAKTLEKTMLENVIKSQRTGDYEVDRHMEEAARLIMGTMGQAMRDGDQETMLAMMSNDTQAKVETVMSAARARGAGL